MAMLVYLVYELSYLLLEIWREDHVVKGSLNLLPRRHTVSAPIPPAGPAPPPPRQVHRKNYFKVSLESADGCSQRPHARGFSDKSWSS